MNDTGIEKKKKGKPAMQRWRLFRWIAGFLLAGLLIVIVLTILGPLINGQITRPALAQEAIPTAEYLLNNPIPTPEGFPVYLVVEQDTNGFGGDSVNIERFCVQGLVAHDTRMTVKFNESSVYGHFENSYGGALRADNKRGLSHCIWGEVETGLHLLSVEVISDSDTWDYTWAIEITNDGYRHMSNYPFHDESD